MTMKPNKTTHLGLMRHAPTVWNQQKRIQGQADSHLTPYGETLSEKWGRQVLHCGWERILCSDLGRARDTVRGLNRGLNLPVNDDPRLREQHWGDWTGRTLKEIRRGMPHQLIALEAAGWQFQPPNGESRLQVWERSRAALMEAADRWPGANILVVTHEGVIKALLYRLLDRAFLPEELGLLKAYHLHTVLCDGVSLSLQELNAIGLGT